MNASTDTQDKIIALFNRTELREGEKIIDNRDSVIAKELGILTSKATTTITAYLDHKFEAINKKDISKDVEPINTGNEIELIRIEALESKLSSLKFRYKTLLASHKKVNRDSDRLKVCKEMIIEGFNTREITSALGYRNRSGLYDLIKRLKNITFVEYKKQLLNE